MSSVVTKYAFRFGWLIGAFVLSFAAPAVARDLEQVTWYVGYTPGGSYDGYARVITKHLGKYLPGSPSVVVKYMPGAGSRTLAQYLAVAAKKDGSEFGQLHRDVIVDEMLSGTKTQVDARTFAYIGSPTREDVTCFVWHQAAAQSIEDAKSKDVVLGMVNPAAAEGMLPRLINKVLGTRFKPIGGYSGGAEQYLAMERREIDGRCVSWNTVKSTKADWIKEKKLSVILQVALTRNPDLGDAPLIMEKIPNDLDKQAVKLIFSGQEIGNPVVAPPGTPTEMLRTLREAFSNATRDPELLKDAESVNVTIAPVSGREIEDIVRSVFETPEEAVERARSLISMQ